jgi:hypothetical protein
MAKAPCLSSEAESARGTIDSCADHKPLTMHELNSCRDGCVSRKAVETSASRLSEFGVKRLLLIWRLIFGL